MKKQSQLLVGLVFAALVWAALLLFEKTLLFRAQELSLWLPTQIWFAERMAAPAGMLAYIANFLNQFFFYPWLGALLLVGLWLLVYLLVLRVFEIPGRWTALAFIPVSLLVGCTMEVGYWIFQIKTPSYLFYGTIGLTFTMAAVWGYQKMKKDCWRYIYLAFLFAGGYPLFGFYALFAGLLIAILTLCREKGCSRFIVVALCVVGIAVAPCCYYYVYSMSRLHRMYTAALPAFYFVANHISFWTPHILLFVSLIALCFFKDGSHQEAEETMEVQKCEQKGKNFFHTPFVWNIGVGALCLLFILAFWYKDDNFHTELKVEAAMNRMDYKEVLNVIKKENKRKAAAAPRFIKKKEKYNQLLADLEDDLAKERVTRDEYDKRHEELLRRIDFSVTRHTEPTRLIVMAKNLALLKLGRIGDEMFHYLDGGARPATPLDVRMMQVGGKMLYYNYGRFNFCYRWCLEDGVEFGWKTEYLKYMAKTSILQGEYKPAEKYLKTLSKTLFHKKWAAKYLAYLDDYKLVASDKEFSSILPLYKYVDQLDGDNSLLEIYLLNYFAHSFNEEATPLFDEIGMMCALTLKDIPTFWQNFFRYAKSHRKDRMPSHYQEAALLFGNLEPGKVDISNMPFDKTVEMKFRSFMEYARQNAIGDNVERNPEVKQRFYERFGDTYYYFYFFVRDVKSY